MTSPLSALDLLRLFLRPPGRGILTLSTGAGYASRLHAKLYGTDVPKDVQQAWQDTLQKIRRAEVAILGIPSDTGAGVMRGANFGPLGIREAYLQKYGSYPKSVIDLGDVVVVPQLLHDEMLSESQKAATRSVLYPDSKETLPVSPLSIAESVYGALRELNPALKVCLLGGDHSVSWPALVDVAQKIQKPWGVVHFDAHPDLIEHRFGVRYCYTTWAYHVLSRLKPASFVQVGIRTTGKTKEHWTQNYPIQQVWADEVKRDPTAALEAIVAGLHAANVQALYVTNDIDGTDSAWTPATGTPEAKGLEPGFVISLIERLGRDFDVIGGDVVEVAPPLSGSRDYFAEATCVLGADYLQTLIQSL